MHFGRHYVILALPTSMPCEESPTSECFPEEGGIGYARHFIQQWSKANGIPFVWMLDDNVQLCHELNVGTGGTEEWNYEPCSFTHVMNSLERLVLADDSETIVVQTEPSTQGTPKSIRSYAEGAPAPNNACPPESDLQLRGGTKPHTGDKITTVGDLCGRPGHYGVIGIARHRHDVSINEETAGSPFGVTHSVYSFSLLNVNSTVSKKALYPMKMLWEDIEFNHIVDEQGLVVCMFRKFSHSKKNLQPLQPRRPPSVSVFQHKNVALAELRKWHESGSDSDVDVKYSDGLLKHLSEHVLRLIPVEVVLPTGDNELIVTDGLPFEIDPVARVVANPVIDMKLLPDSGSVLVRLLGGVQNESFGVLKSLIKHKVSNMHYGDIGEGLFLRFPTTFVLHASSHRV